jgi:anti-sigma B factor antagonist
MNNKITAGSHYSIIHVKGNLDGANSDELMKDIEKQFAAGTFDILIDFENVDYISSMGIGTLISAYKDIKEKSGHLILFGIQESIKEIFDRTQLSKRLIICDKQEDALVFLTDKVR